MAGDGVRLENNVLAAVASCSGGVVLQQGQVEPETLLGGDVWCNIDRAANPQNPVPIRHRDTFKRLP